MTDHIEMIEIGTRKIVLRGLGKMFYQEGFPMSMASKVLAAKGVEISWLHVADELLKNGWRPDTVVRKLREDMVDGEMEDKAKALAQIEMFCSLDYFQQRAMIFEYLFGKKIDDPTNVDNPVINAILTQAMANEVVKNKENAQDHK